MNKKIHSAFQLAFLCSSLSSCEPVMIETHTALVPPTADQDSRLPSITIDWGKGPVRIHLRTFGDSGSPLLLVVPGSLSDVRAYLPFAVFADRYRVVIWDLPGQGLSQRVNEDMLSYRSMTAAMHAMKTALSPDKPVTVIGHSWSAFFTAMYAGEFPGDTNQIALMESPGLTSEFQNEAGSAVNLTSKGYADMNWVQGSMTAKGHDLLDFQTLAMLKSGVRDFFLDRDNPPAWPVWRVGGLALIVWERSLLNQWGAFEYDYSGGLKGYPGETLLIGSSASPIGFDFQTKTNATLFSRPTVSLVDQSGHRMITENWTALESDLRAWLEAYRTGGEQ